MSTDAVTTEATEEAVTKLQLDVAIEQLGACERRIKIVVPQADINRYFDNAFGEMMPLAAIPGFRVGKAPRKLVESRFRKDVADQVKGQVLMDSITQATEESKLSAISEPNLDISAIVLPEQGPLTFEFTIEVRPEFDMPEWKGLTVEKPVREFSPQDIDQQIKQILRRHGRLIPFDGAAQLGDYITTTIVFKQDDKVISELPEQQLCLRKELSFRDGKISDFGKIMTGAKAGDKRSAQTVVSDSAPNEALRGQSLTAEFEILDVKKLEMPELDKEFLNEIGEFANEGELRDFVLEELKRQLSYYQRQRAREQITKALTAGANWELPKELLQRQSTRELQRKIMELQRSGFPDDQIRMHVNTLRQNAMAHTAIALKEHFILERLAEDEKITDEPDDYTQEIALIAQQTEQSVRRVRAQMEKNDSMDILRNQIIERKAIDMVLEHAKFNEIPFVSPVFETEALDEAATGEEAEEAIPEAVAVAETGPAPGMSAPTAPTGEHE